jgi:hypothetical protein
MAKGDRSVSPFRDDDDIRQDMYDDLDNRNEAAMEKREKRRDRLKKRAKARVRKRLSGDAAVRRKADETRRSKRVARSNRISDDDPMRGESKIAKLKERAEKKGTKNRADMDARKRQRALRSLVGKASDIQKLNKSDISKVSSFANKAAKNFKAPETKDLMKEVVKQTPVTKGLLSAVAKGAGLIGAAATMNEFRKVHKEIKKKGSGSFGSKSLMEILK